MQQIIMHVVLLYVICIFCVTVEGCGKYCKDSDGDFYCCEHPTTNTPPPGYNHGRCPAPEDVFCNNEVMEFSPRFRPRKHCKYDNECHNTKEKCCYDICTQRKVCIKANLHKDQHPNKIRLNKQHVFH